MEQNRNDVLSAAFSKARNMIQKDSANNIGNSLGNISSVFDTMPNVQSYPMNENVDYEYNEPIYTQPINTFGIQQSNIKNTNLPTEIFESMTKNVIDTKPLSNGMPELGGSVLDNLKIQPKQTKKIVNEQIMQPQQISSNIDYSLIKTIVEDCVKKYSSALKKSILNESKELMKENVGTLQAMKLGNKFSFVDDEGNLYEAKLTFIKNLNENKNKGGK